MPFDWLKHALQEREKADNYAEKTLAAYRLGMKAGGSIRGVRIVCAEESCAAAQQLPRDQVYHPDDAPRLPLSDCPFGRTCTCVYRPVMAYEGNVQ
jgi:hypothetical protein